MEALIEVDVPAAPNNYDLVLLKWCDLYYTADLVGKRVLFQNQVCTIRSLLDEPNPEKKYGLVSIDKPYKQLMDRELRVVQMKIYKIRVCISWLTLVDTRDNLLAAENKAQVEPVSDHQSGSSDI